MTGNKAYQQEFFKDKFTILLSCKYNVSTSKFNGIIFATTAHNMTKTTA